MPNNMNSNSFVSMDNNATMYPSTGFVPANNFPVHSQMSTDNNVNNSNSSSSINGGNGSNSRAMNNNSMQKIVV